MSGIYAYHVVTERPMQLGQHMIFDETHHNGVYQRVYDKLAIVEDIYAHPEKYDAKTLEHHTCVALRELALEEVRRRHYAKYPSRMGCLYVSESIAETEKWAALFVAWGRPTYSIVEIKVMGNLFIGNANHCFAATTNKTENLKLAKRYWQNAADPQGEPPIKEILADGDIEITGIIKEINANL